MERTVVKLSQLVAGPNQRSNIKTAPIDDLLASIPVRGLINPLIVRALEGGKKYLRSNFDAKDYFSRISHDRLRAIIRDDLGHAPLNAGGKGANVDLAARLAAEKGFLPPEWRDALAAKEPEE